MNNHVHVTWQPVTIFFKCMFQDIFLSLVLRNKRKESWSSKASIHHHKLILLEFKALQATSNSIRPNRSAGVIHKVYMQW